MSLVRRLERRDYAAGAFLDPLHIPSNLEVDPYSGAGVLPPMSMWLALAHPAVQACMRIITDVISSFPVHAFNAQQEQIDPTPAKLVNPSVKTASMREWVAQVVTSLLIDANAYGMISGEDRLGYFTQVDLLYPLNVTVRWEDGRKRFRIDGRELTTDQVWHLPGRQLPGDVSGISPVRNSARTIWLGLMAEQFGYDYFANGVHPTAHATSDQRISPADAKIIKKRIKDGQRGRDIIVTGLGIKLDPWTIQPNESQFLETAKHNDSRIAQIFGVPAEFIDATTGGKADITYANREQRAQDFLAFTVNPLIGRIEDALSAWFPRGTYVKFNTGALLRSDLQGRANAYKTLIDCGVLVPNEARALEEYPPLPGGDVPPRPQAAAPAPDNNQPQSRGEQ